jgi:DNA-binding response OmpR family regulator
MAQILLIEPDRLLAELVATACERAGHTPTICANAQTAISAADAISPDLVILELQLIEHSGIEFLYEFRSYHDWQTVPAVVYSRVPVEEFTGSMQMLQKELGVKSYLYKPTTSLELLLDSINDLVPVNS